MLGSLEEGILVIKDQAVDYSNEIFQEIQVKAGIEQGTSADDILDAPMFKIYRQTGDDSDESVSRFVKLHCDIALTLRSVLAKNQKFCSDKIFELHN